MIPLPLLRLNPATSLLNFCASSALRINLLNQPNLVEQYTTIMGDAVKEKIT